MINVRERPADAAGSYKPVLAMPFRAIGSLSPLVRMVKNFPP
jgi:hypothetical protein